MLQREQLASRLGFVLLSAGCAIGLGNVWRFPYITGKYGGAVFLVVYLLFLLFVGLPVLIMEFSVGRASKRNMAHALEKLEPKGTWWHKFGIMSPIGNYLLMMFYIPIAGWMLCYCWFMLNGTLEVPTEQVPAVFSGMLGSPWTMLFWTVVVSASCFAICGQGLQKGVERVVKLMMLGLLFIMVGLAIHSCFLEGGGRGMEFYLRPDFGRAVESGFMALVNDAMNQAFFTLSVGMGSMCIFGSYLKKDRSLTQESVIIVALDTFVALTAGLIIFPACFAFNVTPDAGPGLIFVTLPNIFNNMAWGRFWGFLFFVFMSAAALTTVIAVLENIIAFFMDGYGWSRRKATIINFVVLTILTLPCILGFNVWSGFEPFGKGSSVLDLEDFIISNNILPLGSFLFMLFCCHRYGWGWDNFVAEADEGRGMKFPKFLRFYLTWILPVIFLFIFAQGYIQKFF
ncbi:sodium-dependent transporter [uncultured Mailhella sp.]|uniref:sodium-dependent transporter n=1 Tax=uncultured Mailhella sp. TaxID=1981031 RepID=UPI0025EA2D0F|nr:sodium-dependent transporter [uncultured Mailhella sp.]